MNCSSHLITIESNRIDVTQEERQRKNKTFRQQQTIAEGNKIRVSSTSIHHISMRCCSSLVRRFALLLVAVLLLHSGCQPCVTVSAAGVFPPRAVTGPYRQTKSVHFFNVDGPSSLQGSMAMQPATFGTHFPISSNATGVPEYSAEIVLPNSSDDIQACASDTLRSTNEFGETFTGKVMLIRRGACAFGLKGKRAELAGAAGLIIYGCPTSAPTNCAPGLQQPTVAVTEVHIPVVYIQSADGEALAAYLNSRLAARRNNATTIPAAVTMRVASTGALVASERDALKQIAAESTMQQDTITPSYGNLRPWNSANMVADDPCLNRLAGIWCENGHIVELYVNGMQWKSTLPAGTMSTAFGALTELRYFWVANNLFKGAVPDALCQLTKVQELYFQFQMTGSYDGLTSLPACFSAFTSLNTFQIGNNAITSMPDFGSSPKLISIDISFNRIAAFPPSFSNWTQLQSLTAPSNQISSLPSIAGFSTLSTLNLASNQLSNTLLATAFDGMPALVTLDVSNNQLKGPLPNFQGTSALQSMSLSNNQFASIMPTAWAANIPALVTLKASRNGILSPIKGLSSLVNLQTVDLSYNALEAYTGDATQTGDVGAYLSGACGPSVITFNFAHNKLAGRFGSGWFQLSKALRTLDISYNQVTSIAPDLFTTTITSLDASYNVITSWGATSSPSSSFLYLNLLGNPGLVSPTIPLWMVQTDTTITYPGSVYECPRIVSSSNILTTIQVDAQFTSFKKCQCIKGMFGTPPLCSAVPQVSTLDGSGMFSSAEVGSTFQTIVGSTSGRHVSNITDPDSQMIDRSFTDSWFGDQRLTLGIQTSFVVDLRNVASGTVRFVRLHLYLNTALFDDVNDVLSIYEGDASLGSTRVAARRGTDSFADTLPFSLSALSMADQSLYGSQITALGNMTQVWEVVVYGPLATVSFDSRDVSGQHFFSTYTFSTDCTELGLGYFFDTEMARCRAPLLQASVSGGIRIAVYITAAVALAFISFTAIIVIRFFDTPIVRAASRPFLLLVLVFLAMMSLGSLLYAAIPSETATGRAICQGRVWLSAWPLTGILAVLLAKTNRISNIFNAKVLQVRKVEDTELIAFVAGLLTITSVFLAVYSGLPINEPRVAEGTGTLAGKLVAECHNNSSFGPWIAVLLVYFFLLMGGAAFLAFRTRDLPSRFNESTHIMNALFLLLLVGALLVPLDFWAVSQDSPDSAMLLQGVGQSLLVILLTGVIYAPKLFLLLSGEKGAVTTQGTSTLAKDSSTGDNGTILSHISGGSHGKGKIGVNTSKRHDVTSQPVTLQTGNVSSTTRATPVGSASPTRALGTRPSLPVSRNPLLEQKAATASSLLSDADSSLDLNMMTPETLAAYRQHQQNVRDFADFVSKQRAVQQLEDIKRQPTSTPVSDAALRLETPAPATNSAVDTSEIGIYEVSPAPVAAATSSQPLAIALPQQSSDPITPAREGAPTSPVSASPESASDAVSPRSKRRIRIHTASDGPFAPQ